MRQRAAMRCGASAGLRLAGRVGLLLLGFMGFEACYNPDYSTAIYRCDVYACPVGQVCNSDKICVVFPVAGCTNGGIQAADRAFLCPGATNRCSDGFDVCAEPRAGLACQTPPAGVDMGGSATPPCQICCGK